MRWRAQVCHIYDMVNTQRLSLGAGERSTVTLGLKNVSTIN